MSNGFREFFTDKNTLILVLVSVFSGMLTVFRIIWTGRADYFFLNWNLFLAMIPWVISSVIFYKKTTNKPVIILSMALWLLFFPNSPYILTDIIHLGKTNGSLVWYDLILLLSYAFAGLLFGFVSLRMIEKIVARVFRFNLVWIITILLIYLSCFGVYLGRFLRWNSWDLVMNMRGLFHDVLSRIADPFAYKTTWGFTILFGTLLNILFLAFKVFERNGVQDEQ